MRTVGRSLRCGISTRPMTCWSGNAYEAQCVFFERNDGATNEPSNSADWCGSRPRCACETRAAHPLREERSLHGPYVFQGTRADGQQSENRYKEGRRLGSESRGRAKKDAGRV